MAFTYEVFCPWERSIGIEQVRRCPALAPLAALTPGITAADLPALGQAIDEAPELTPAARLDLRALTYFIAGRRFHGDLLTFLVESKAMEESATYRYVMEKYRAEGREEGREEGLREAQRRIALKLLAEGAPQLHPAAPRRGARTGARRRPGWRS